MKTIVVMYALIMLIMNFGGYKNLFRSKKDLQRDIQDSMSKLESSNVEKKTVQGIAITFSFFILWFQSSFYIIAGNVLFAQYKYLFVFAALMAVYKFMSSWHVAKAIANEKMSTNWYSRALVPLNTVFIPLFIYLYINM